MCSDAATAQKHSRCRATAMTSGRPAFCTRNTMSEQTRIGTSRAGRSRRIKTRGPKATTNDNRYPVSGRIHSSGTAAMSVDR